MKDAIQIGNRMVGGGQRALIIAEIAQAHDGSLGLAHQMIDAAADAGADAVKFQTHIADAESSRQEAFRIKFSPQDPTRYDYWKRLEFSKDGWAGLQRHASERGILFLSSVFSNEAFDLINNIGVPAWKVASGELGNGPLLDRMIATGAPLLISSGMSRIDEVEALTTRLRDAGSPFAVFQCTSMYPTPLEKVGLNMLEDLRGRLACPVGLSDHSGQVFPGLAALARGVDMLELHLTLDRRMFGPDVSSSLTVAELRLVTEARDAFALLDQNPVNKDGLAAELAHVRSLFGRSVALTRDLEAGVVLTAEMLTLKKPEGGIAPEMMQELVGRTLRRKVLASDLLSLEDFA